MERVLVVDDARFMRMQCTKALREAGYEVAEAENGAEAVRQYEEWKPGLVLMDVTMPEMDGIEAVKAIKEKDPDARIVMVSAIGQQAMVMSAIEAGALDFVLKPFEPKRLLEAVEKALAAAGET
ncbi:MAG: response regulator [Limnochordia bacterium]|jgi:two-component system chemotaxis response regulator CheY